MHASQQVWLTIVDTHHSWRDFVAAISPRAERSSTSSFTTARQVSTNVCMPCYLFGNLYPPGQFDRPVVTARLGVLPCCAEHYETFCTNCMGHTSEAYGCRVDGLAYGERHDVDSQGRPLPPYSFTCDQCRHGAFEWAVHRILSDCARSGPVYGGQAYQDTAAYDLYVEYARGQATSMAKLAVEELFLIDHTGWKELFPLFWQLQVILYYCLATGYDGFSDSHHAEIRHFDQIVYRIWADDDDSAPAHFTLNTVYRSFQQEVVSGLFHKAGDSNDLRQAFLPPFDYPRDKRLCSILHQTLADFCIETWCNDRVNSGLWVLPSDEIYQYLDHSLSLHSDIDDIAKEATCPQARQPQVNGPVYRAYENNRGRFNLPDPDQPSHRNGQQPFLPPQFMLQKLDSRFADILQIRLSLPLSEIVQVQRLMFGDGAKTESICDNLSLEQILGVLREELAWIEGEMVARAKSQLKAVARTGGSTVVTTEDLEEWRDEFTDQELAQEPRIEVVESAATPVFGVQEGWSSHSSDAELLEVDGEEEDEELVYPPSSTGSVSDGSKEEVPEEQDDEAPSRPSPDSGHTSSSGDSTSTVLITPDESPALVSEVQLADATYATSTAILAVSDMTVSPTSSPKLGKRKSPDDDFMPQLARPRPTTPKGEDERKAEEEVKDEVKLPQTEEETPLREEAYVRPSVPSRQETKSPGVQVIPPSSIMISQEPSPEREVAEVDEERMVSVSPRDNPSPASSHYDSREWEDSSQLSSEVGPVMVPFIPPTWAKLGPGATGIILRAWSGAQEILKECRCTICVRSQKQTMNQILFEDAQLRIA